MAIPSNFLTKGPIAPKPIEAKPLAAQEFAEKYPGQWVKLDIYKNRDISMGKIPDELELTIHGIGRAFVLGYYTQVSGSQMVVVHVDPSQGWRWKDVPTEIKRSIWMVVPMIEEELTIMAISPTILIAPTPPVDIRIQFPHDCYCGSPCFKMYSSVECSNASCRHYTKIGNC